MSDKRIPEIFVDGIGRNRFTGGVIRLDLLSASEALDQSKSDVPAEITHRLILSPQGFARTVSALNRLMDQLTKGGIVSAVPAEMEAKNHPVKGSADKAPRQNGKGVSSKRRRHRR